MSKHISMGTLLVGLLIAAFTFALTFWYYSYYNQPQITYFSNEKYLRVKEFAVGNLTLENSGRVPDTNVSVTIDAVVNPENLSTSLPPSEYTLDILGGETVLTIVRLRPNESVQVSFITNSTDEGFRIRDVVSDSGKIKNRTERAIEEQENRSRLIEIGLVGVIASLFVFTILSEQIKKSKREKERG